MDNKNYKNLCQLLNQICYLEKRMKELESLLNN